MKLLAAIVLLFLAVAEAHHTPEHTLRGPRFSAGKVHVYDVEVNVTSGVRGLSNQVSKSAFKAELQIYAKTEREHILKITKVYTSGSVKAVESKVGYVPLNKNSELEDRLSTPIKFTLENGKISSYTLSPRETLESKKIKKSILRSLEMYVSEEAIEQMESRSKPRIPVRYNSTKLFGSEMHTTRYLITVSPNVEFPYDLNVYNITRSEDFEGERYHSHIFEHNFESQGCPHVCGTGSTSDRAGCPAGFEPHQSPVKTYVHHQHHLALQRGVMTPEIIKITEVHTAKMYDQDMEVLISHYIRRVGYNTRTIEEPIGQIYTDLDDQETEINESEIDEKCDYKSSREAVEVARKLLGDISNLVVRADLDNKESTLIGEKIILLKNALSRLEEPDLRKVAGTIMRKESLKMASEEDKVKRQIWMDILPLIGTENSVSFIFNYIKENIGREILVWEAKEILEALPQNINRPSERTIRELRTLLELPTVSKYHLLHSAMYTCLGRVIGIVCNGTETERSLPVQKSSWFGRESFNSQGHASVFSPLECPQELVTEIVKEISEKLKTTKKQDEIIIYVETLAHIGMPEVLPTITEYAYGIAENLQDFKPSYHEFVKLASVYSLHKVATRHPEDVREIVSLLFFNETEIPKLRAAAFGVLIRCQPSLEVLQHVAVLSWTEKSNEVGSYVTSTMDTFGNSTLPCMLLTSYRIKQVMPMMKRFDIGMQHAKNLLWTYFDDARTFGVKGRVAYIPSNNSIVPSGLYHALAYSSDSLTDNLIQSALNIQGLTQRKIIQYMDQQIFGIATPEAISPSKSNEIFEEAKILERIPETLRFTTYKKMFYSSAFYYLDLENMKTQIDTLREYLSIYLKRTSFDYSGHLVKVFLPSSFHTVTVAKTLPYPVEFQMQQPIVLALKIESKERNPTLPNFHFLIRPSMYLSKLFTNQLKNVGDCKEVGVYYEHKIAMSYPLEVKFKVEGLMNVTVSYKVPELPKKILYYFTESGTYAGQKSLETLPSSENREPIRTLPSPFKYSPKIMLVGMPPLQIDLNTEEIGLITENMPTTPLELLDITIRRVLNAGWRYKAANITIEEHSRVWPKDTEVTFSIHYNRSHVTKGNVRVNRGQDSPWSMSTTEEYPRNAKVNRGQDSPWSMSETEEYPRGSEWVTTEQSQTDDYELSTEDSPQKWFWRKDEDDKDMDENWSKDLKPSDISKNKKLPIFVDQARRISAKLSSIIPHITHVLNVEIETKPVHSNAYIRIEYNHTHTRSLHAVHVDAGMKIQGEHETRKISFDHLMGFWGKPDEFQYDSHNDEHQALFISAFRSRPIECSCPWKDVEIVAKGAFLYEPLSSLLNEELENKVDRKYFLSEKHDQCIQDVKDGHSLSTNCVKAIRERSIYNKLRMSVLWSEGLPQSVKSAARRLDTLFKHVYYNHMAILDEQNTENRMYISLNHIDKLTDKPVFDVTIKKPEETIELRRVRTVGLTLDDPLSSVHDVLGVDLMELTNNTYPPTCVMMEKYIRTFDLQSYPISLDRCSYILSAHCTDYKNFAIISKILSTDGTKEIHIHVGPHTIILTPKSGNGYTIKYDGQDYTVSRPVVFDEDTAEIYAFTEKFSSHDHLHVVAKKAGIKVVYDGKNVKVQVDPVYKGETCGLCSEFDGETVRELTGVDRCLYSHPDDFVNSAIINRDTCRKQPIYPYICENEDTNMAWRRKSSNDEYEPSIKRNLIHVKGNEICFSVRAVPVCEDDSKPSETESQQIGFHCLPKQDITARRMVSEAKRRSLGEIENKSVDFEENVEIAKMC